MPCVWSFSSYCSMIVPPTRCCVSYSVAMLMLRLLCVEGRSAAIQSITGFFCSCPLGMKWIMMGHSFILTNWKHFLHFSWHAQENFSCLCFHPRTGVCWMIRIPSFHVMRSWFLGENRPGPAGPGRAGWSWPKVKGVDFGPARAWTVHAFTLSDCCLFIFVWASLRVFGPANLE